MWDREEHGGIGRIRKVYGPPGTGKTTRLLGLLEEELKTTPASRIAYVSFTREGAYQGAARAKEKFGIPDAEFKYFRTLHSLAFRELDLSVSQVMQRKNYYELSKKLGMNFVGYYSEEFQNNDDKYLFLLDLRRNNENASAPYMENVDVPTLDYVARNLLSYKKHYNVLDYTDMIARYVERDTPLDVDVAFVDEAQDLTSLQWRMVWSAFRNVRTLYIAGDDDQAIYEWSGADVNAFLDIKGDEEEVLNVSWRLPDDVLEMSKSITAQITRRADKPYHGTGRKGKVNFVVDLDEIVFNPNETYMFLARNNVHLTPICERLRFLGQLYRFKGKPSIVATKAEVIHKFEEYRRRPFEINPYSRLGAALKPKIDITRPWYDNVNWDEDEITYIRDVLRAGGRLDKINIDVATIHSVKGAEADNVILLSDVTRRTAMNMHGNPDSEHRVFYVGCTRAKKTVTIVEPTEKYSYQWDRRTVK